MLIAYTMYHNGTKKFLFLAQKDKNKNVSIIVKRLAHHIKTYLYAPNVELTYNTDSIDPI